MNMDLAVSDFRRTFSLTGLWLHLGWADLSRRYRRTYLGPLWHTLTMAIFIGCMGVIWAAVLKVQFRDYALHLTPSLIGWSLISSIFIEGAVLFLNARQVVLTINVPLPVLTMGLMWRLVLTHLHHLLLMVALIVFLRIEITREMFLLVPGIALVYLNGLWMTSLIGMICLRFRDLQMIVTIGMQIAQFVTPVFWPVSFISPNLEWVVRYNPLFHLLELIRNPLVGDAPTIENWIWCMVMLFVGSTVTFIAYAAVRNRMAYWY
tara:strand:+ start:1637 stop:2425 length:789 start_codon:yes stop_codon:yes gene_type:complete